MGQVIGTMARLPPHLPPPASLRSDAGCAPAGCARPAIRSCHVAPLRRKRTRHLIELGGLVVKAGIVDLTGDDRATLLGALLWMANKLKSDQGEHARALWAAKGEQAFEADPATHKGADR